MKEEDFKDIKRIALLSQDITFGASMNKWQFKPKYEKGEMAMITWIEVWKDDEKVAYIRQSNCNIYFK